MMDPNILRAITRRHFFKQTGFGIGGVAPFALAGHRGFRHAAPRPGWPPGPQIFMNTGSQVFGRPSMGSWLTYGLGSESRDLPGFIVLLSGENAPDGGKSCWGSGFLPTVYQGVEFRSKGDPVLFVSNPDGVDALARREAIDLVTDLNRVQR